MLEIGTYRLVIIGGGPAGLAPLLAAHRKGLLGEILSGGVAIIEASDYFGVGGLGQYAINSDSTGTTFVDCLCSPESSALTSLQSHPLTREIAAAGNGAVPLPLAGRFLSLVGETLASMVAEHPGCAVFAGHRALCAKRGHRHWATTIADCDGRIHILSSQFVVIATGATQPAERLAAEQVAGINLVERYQFKLMQSGTVFVSGGLDAIASRLARSAEPQVAIIGGSTSAAALANALLQHGSLRFAACGVTILHRRPLRIYYPSVQDALNDGYMEFNAEDICPISKRVFRFAGFRLDSRDLIMRARGIGGRPAEPRLALHQLKPTDPEAIAIMDRADLVIAALGYRPRALPLFEADGSPIVLHAQTGPSASMVDSVCRVIDAQARPIAGLFGIGLAAGFLPRGKLGGEPSFSGQANGLWLWQNDVGMLIVEAVIDDLPDAATSVCVTHMVAAHDAEAVL